MSSDDRCFISEARPEVCKGVRVALSEARDYAQACADLVRMIGLELPPNPPRWLYK